MSFKIHDLLSAIRHERRKAKSDEDDEFVMVPKINREWQIIFDIYFLSPMTRLAQTSGSTTSDDDLVFYVTRKAQSESDPNVSHLVEVFRHHDIKRRPKLGAPEYDWEETIYLNLVLHQFEYMVTTAVCIKASDKHLQIIKRSSIKVYASPSRRDMENKGTGETITYPSLYFTVDNFEDTFCEMIVNEGQMVCVELVARNPTLRDPRVLFLGSIKYEALRKAYDTRATTSARVAHRMSLGMYQKRRVEFVKMRGPSGKGHAEMAVSRPRSSQSGIASPQSSATTPLTNNVDQGNWNNHQTLENDIQSQWVPPTSRAQHHASAAATAEVESTDNHQELSDESGGFLGRTLNQAMNWVRGSNPVLDPSTQPLPLQTCLTYLTLPCHFIVKDILESNSVPILTAQQSK